MESYHHVSESFEAALMLSGRHEFRFMVATPIRVTNGVLVRNRRGLKRPLEPRPSTVLRGRGRRGAED